MKINIDQIRPQFPILSRKVNGADLVYLDNGATSQKPQRVIDAISSYYQNYNSNVHRGVHSLSQEATEAMEGGRKKVQKLINAKKSEEIVFTSGTTEAINLLAHSFGSTLDKGDEIIVSTMEHHSNIVPWQMLCERVGCVLKVIPVSDSGDLEMDAYQALLSDKTKLVSICHVSNALGTVNPVRELISEAKKVGAAVLLDGAQSIHHLKVDVQELDVDFYAFSAHKMYGPTGIGALYIKESWGKELPPFLGGGEMISTVSFEGTTYNEPPHKFEAGTPNIAGIIGMGEAVDFILETGVEEMGKWEAELISLATEKLKAIGGITIIGEAKEKSGVISFLIDGGHPYDVGVILDQLGVAIRTGHHCTQPLMDRFGIPGTCRASFAVYNNHEDVDRLIIAVERAKKMLV
ncbi:MAG: cysteine desulfurase/selenocysteine lyase [Granulosicoccus sp.]|jgi:cysteine desulfurase/selenocysteine lyase